MATVPSSLLPELEQMERRLRELAQADAAVSDRLFVDFAMGVYVDQEEHVRATRDYWTSRARADLAVRVADELAGLRRTRR